MRTTLASSVLFLAASQLASAHSWIEELSLIGTNGTFVGTPGYSRGNVLRTAAGFTDASMVNLIPPDGRTVNDILSTDLICRSSQTTQNQTDGSPRLQAPAGAAIALRYQENGHVTLPDNQPGKPDNRGTNFVYGTSQSLANDTLLAIHRQWNANGTGGDGRGSLLSTLNFDDGQCFQGNNGAIGAARAAEFQVSALWCQQDIVLPSDLEVDSVYTLYWVWDWPTLPGTTGYPDGKQELYTTCMDVEIVADDQSSNVSAAAVSTSGEDFIQFEAGQDISNAAVSSQVVNITNPTVVQSPETIAFTAVASSSVSLASVSASSTVDTTMTTSVTSFVTVTAVAAVTSPSTTTTTTTNMPVSTSTIYQVETRFVTLTASTATAVAKRAAPTHSTPHHAFQVRARMPAFPRFFDGH